MRISTFAGVSALALTFSAFGAFAAAPVTAPVDTGEIVVTAQHTESLLSKTPIAMSAVTGQALRDAGILSPTNLATSVPNLSIDRINGLQITIRGVTSTDGTEKGDPSAAFLLDGIYIARPQAQDVSFFDIDRVEVLRGPQGTLYGRNTTAGVVNVISNKPQNSFQAAANASYGNYKSFAADGMINVPLGDKLAARGAVSYDRRDSYLIGVPGDPNSLSPFRENIAGRLQVLYKPTDKISILVKADDAELKGSRSTAVPATTFYDFNTLNSFLDPAYAGNSHADPLQTHFTQNVKPAVNDHSYGLSGELKWDFGPATFTYLGSIRRYSAHEDQNFHLGGPSTFGALFFGHYQQESHEVRVNLNDAGPLKLQVGGYYFHEKSGIALYIFNLVGPVFGFPQEPTENKAYAGFAQGTYSFTPHIRLTAGGRYSHDDKFRYGHTVFQQTLTFNPATDARLQNAAGVVSSKFTWMVNLDADVGAHGLAYAKVATGYKAGGFNDGCIAGATTLGELCNQPRDPILLYYRPETLTSYEIGYKGKFFDNMLQVTSSAFHYEYKNLQLSTVTNFNGAPAQLTTNAGAAKVDGIELETVVNLDQHNKIEAGFDYLNARYAVYCPKGAVTNGSSTCLTGTPDYKGRSLDRSPKTVFSGGYTFTMPVGDAGKIAAAVHTKLMSKYFVTAFGIPQQYVTPGHTKTDLTLTYTAAKGAYYVQGFVQNLENTITVNNIDSFANATPGDPRTFGVRVGAKF